MNKKELITSIAEKSGLSKKDSELALLAFITSVEEVLLDKDSVKIVGFGNFETRERKGRAGIIQLGDKKGQEWKSEDSIVPVFKASKKLKELINE